MSVALMSEAFKASVTSTQKLVMLALCDAANDQGECYPSVSTLSDKCSLSERSIQAAMAELESMGYMRRELRKGRSTVYWMTPAAGAPRSKCTPQQLHPTPARRSPPPPQQLHPTPAAGAPITITEPSIEPSRKRKAPAMVEIQELVEAGFSAEVAAEFIEHKRSAKAPLTARAWADHLSESMKAGWTPLAAAEKVMAKSWKGFEARYVVNERAPMPTQPIQQPHVKPDETARYLAELKARPVTPMPEHLRRRIS